MFSRLTRMKGHGVTGMLHQGMFRAIAARMSTTVIDLPENGSPVIACRQPNSHQPGISQSSVCVAAIAFVMLHLSNLTVRFFDGLAVSPAACCPGVLPSVRFSGSAACPFPEGLGRVACGIAASIASSRSWLQLPNCSPQHRLTASLPYDSSRSLSVRSAQWACRQLKPG